MAHQCLLLFVFTNTNERASLHKSGFKKKRKPLTVFIPQLCVCIVQLSHDQQSTNDHMIGSGFDEANDLRKAVFCLKPAACHVCL